MSPQRFATLANLAVALSVALAVVFAALILMGVFAFYIFKADLRADGHGHGFRIKEISEPASRTERSSR